MELDQHYGWLNVATWSIPVTMVLELLMMELQFLNILSPILFANTCLGLCFI